VCAVLKSPHEKPDKRAGHNLMTSESCSEEECHAQIDRLIDDLKRLKVVASRKFRKADA
jgi:hypothetical protein